MRDMKKKVLILLYLFMLCLFITPVHSQEIKAKTEEGKEVMLYPDGTWQYVKTEQHQSSSPSSKPQLSKKLIQGKRGTYSIWIDENTWKISETKFNPSAEFCFTHAGGDAYAMIIDEETQMPLDALKQAAFENAKKAAPDAQIIFAEKKFIHDNEVLYMKMTGTVQSTPFTYLGYYYSGAAGTIQLITYAKRDLFDKFESDLIEFLNGFDVGMQPQKEISFADGSKYKGTIVNGKMQGQGTYLWPNGDKYIGEFTENRATGGWFYKADGRKAWCRQDENGSWIIKQE
jgi:hypothetical protein